MATLVAIVYPSKDLATSAFDQAKAVLENAIVFPVAVLVSVVLKPGNSTFTRPPGSAISLTLPSSWTSTGNPQESDT